MNTAPKKAKKTALALGREFSTADTLHYLRILHRIWMHSLSPPEFKIIAFVFDRTIGWGKRWERITLRQIEHGVTSVQLSYSNGTGLARRTIIDALSRLTGKSYRDQQGLTPLVKDVKSPRSISYSLDFRWQLVASVGEVFFDSAGIAPREGSTCTIRGAGNAPLKVRELHPKMVEGKEEKKDNKTQFENDSFESLSVPPKKSLSTQAPRTGAATKKTLHACTAVSELNALWNTAMAKEFPEAGVWNWTAKERGMVAKMRADFEGSKNIRGTFGDFLQWCVHHWGAMMHWMYPSKRVRDWKGPSLPALPFLLKTARSFFDEYNGARIAAIKKENSALNVAQYEREVAELKAETKKETAKLQETRLLVRNIRTRLNLQRHGLLPVQPLATAKELGIEVNVPFDPHLLDRFNYPER